MVGDKPAQPKRPAHILWAVLMARIYDVFPLLGPICGGQMRTIAFIIYSADIRRILAHIGAIAFIHRFGASLKLIFT